MSGGRCRSTPVPAVEDEGKQPPRESRAREERDEGDRNELGLFGERPLAALLYIGGEGRPGSNGHEGGAAGSNGYCACPRAGRWSGPCPCRVRVLGFQPRHGAGAGPCRSWAVFKRPCSCRPNGLNPFGHL
jgi:hypothetical protein